MAELKATPRNAALGKIADLLHRLRESGNEYKIPDVIPLFGGTGLGELLLGKSPEEINEWSYGNAPMQIVGGGTGSLVPQTKQGRQQGLADTLFAMQNATPLAKASARMVGSLPAAVKHGAEEFAHASAAANPRVIKEKGGNWLQGHDGLELLKGLHTYAAPGDIRMLEKLIADPHPDLMDAEHLRAALKDPKIFVPPELLNTDIARLEARAIEQRRQWQNELNQLRRNEALNSWVNGPLTKYVKTYMGTAEDPLLKLADEGVSQLPLETLLNPEDWVRANARHGRRVASAHGIDQPELGAQAQGWSDLADGLIRPMTVQSVKDSMRSYWPEFVEQEGNWLENAPKHTRLFSFSGDEATDWAGFQHMADELRNALNPESGLPRHLQLTPEQMQQLGMEKAVRHVDAINKFRQAAMEQATLKELETSGAMGKVHKEYPENNPMGMVWKEIANIDKAPEGRVIKKGDGYVAVDANGNAIAQRLPNGDVVPPEPQPTPELAYLQGQLTTEGNIMGHCVGGYCDDVASGNTRIFSLRDAKGEPHVTIEVDPGLTNERQQRLLEAKEKFAQSGVKESDRYDFADWLDDNGYDDLVGINHNIEPAIIQIKGKGNKAPKEEYLPFVQDFVKSGKWSDVGDFHNTGMYKLDNQYLTKDDLLQIHGQPDHVSWEKVNNLLQDELENGQKFKEGGLVEDDYAYPGFF